MNNHRSQWGDAAGIGYARLKPINAFGVSSRSLNFKLNIFNIRDAKTPKTTLPHPPFPHPQIGKTFLTGTK
jgi:hypothetical protein